MCCTDIPHPPGKPEVTDSNTDHISIKWTSPKDDFGSLVTGYNVQRQHLRTRKWTKLNSHPLLVTPCSCSIPTGRDGVIDVMVSAVNGLELVLVADVS